MDLGKLATQDNANEGVWIQAVIYGKKQPFDIKILGADSDAVALFNRERLKSLKINSKNGIDVDDEAIDEILDNNDENVVIRIAGLRSRDKEPLMLNGIELQSDIRSYRLLVEKIPAVKDFIMKISNERTNFLSDRKKN